MRKSHTGQARPWDQCPDQRLCSWSAEALLTLEDAQGLLISAQG